MEFLLNNTNPLKNQSEAHGGANVEGFRKQAEYGAKMRIKPWRTGTKSQQQIAPKGQRKGFRGKTAAAKKWAEGGYFSRNILTVSAAWIAASCDIHHSSLTLTWFQF